MSNLKTCLEHWDKMHEIVTKFNLLPESEKETKRAEARKHFEDHIECMNNLGVKVQKEFDPRFLLPLLYPEQSNLFALSNLTLGSGAGEEEPSSGGRRRSRRQKRSRKITRRRR